MAKEPPPPPPLPPPQPVRTTGSWFLSAEPGTGKIGPAGIKAWRNATLAFLDEDRLLIGAQDGTLGILDAEGILQREMPPAEHESGGWSEILDLALHPDGTHFATGHWTGRVAVRSLDGEVVAMLEPRQPHTDWVVSVEFSPDGSQLLTGSADGTAVLWSWNEDTLRHLRTLEHEAALTTARFSQGGRILTTAKDGTARLLDLDGREALTIRTGPRALLCGAWSPDGSRIATGDDQGIVRTWPVRLEHVLQLARERSGR